MVMTGEQNAPLVVGVDGSPDSLRAADWALRAGMSLQLPVRLLRAQGWPDHVGDDRSATELLADTLARHPGDTSVGVDALDVRADPVPALVDASDSATAVVVGARGHGRLRGAMTSSVS